MEMSGKQIALLITSTRTSAHRPWKKEMFVIETKEKYPKKVAITAWKEQADIAEHLPLGAEINIRFSLENREYNGKWYTDVKAWKMATIQSTATDEQRNSSAKESIDISDDSEIFPF